MSQELAENAIEEIYKWCYGTHIKQDKRAEKDDCAAGQFIMKSRFLSLCWAPDGQI